MVLFDVARQAAAQRMPPVVLYIGPETLLPLTSALTAIVGILLMAWRQVVSFLTKAWHFLFRN
jgi:hypothetical protein